MPQAGPSTLAMAIAALLAVTPFVVIAGLNVIIARRGWTPLPQLVEHYMRRYPLFAAGLSGFFGALVGHVFWSFGDNPAKPPAPLHLMLVAFGVTIAAGIGGALALALIAYAIAPLVKRFDDKPGRR